MEITQDLIQELTSEKNYLYVDAYVGTFTNGDFRHLVYLSNHSSTIIFEFQEN